MVCRFCNKPLKTGELLCPNCGRVTVEDSSSTAVLKIDPRLRKQQDGKQDTCDAPSTSVVLLIRGVRKMLQLQELEDMVFGRADLNTATLPGLDLNPFGAEQRGVSRQHMRMRYHSGKIIITDLESANGTYLNGQKLEPGEPYSIKDGDEVMLGQLALRIMFQ